MTNLSKEAFYKTVTDNTPCCIFHPFSENCLVGIQVLGWNLLVGCSKFYLPIYLIKIILNRRKTNKKYVIQQVFSYFRSIFYGFSLGVTFYGSLCLCWNLDASYYSVLRAGMISGLTLPLESLENQQIDIILFSTQVIETLLNHLSARGAFERTRFSDTKFFMYISAIVMYLLQTRSRKKEFRNLWFYNESASREGSVFCNHKCYCAEHWFRGAKNYFALGYILEAARFVLPRLHILFKDPMKLLVSLISPANLKSGLFLGSYALIYRYICCFLIKLHGEYTTKHTLIAAFVAGISYYIKPDVQMSIIGLITIIQLSWDRFLHIFKVKPKARYRYIVFTVLCGLMMQYRFLQPDYVPSYTKSMLDLVTNGLSSKIRRVFMENIKNSTTLIIPVDKLV